MKGNKWTLCVTMIAVLIFGASLGVSANETYTYHQVQPGETVYFIAQDYEVDPSVIVTASGLCNGGDYIEAYQTLLIDSNAKSNSEGNYEVQAGDTLYQIAQAYGTSVEEIMAANELTADRIYPSQLLLVGADTGDSNDTVVDTTNDEAADTTNGDTAEPTEEATTGTGTTAPPATDNATDTVSSEFTEDEVYMLAKMIYAEARGESYEGQVAVGAVIVNRVHSDLFPDTMSGVLFEDRQFTAYSDGQYNLTPDETAIKAAKEAAAGVDPTGGCLFYWNPVKSPNNAFLNAKPIVVTIGEHVFAK